MAAGKYWFRNVTERRAVHLLLAAAGLVVLLVQVAPALAQPNALPALAPGSAYGSEADREALSKRLAALAVYAADFTQSVHGARGEVLEVSEGYVRLQRPSFKWVVLDPYPQTIVTEGDRLKLYDPDLEQLTIRPLSDALEDTPVSLLTRDDVAIGEAFVVTRIADAEGESYLIDPRSPDTLYRQIQLHFGPVAGGPAAGAADQPWLLIGLDILDHLGQRTEIRFEPDRTVAAIAASEFALDVPPDTDVIGG